MPLSLDTQFELEAARHHAYLHREQYEAYFSFLRKWVALNRAYSELKTHKKEWQRVRAVADDLQSHWPEIKDLAEQLAAMECIGSLSDRSGLLQPDAWGKSAILYLREHLQLTRRVDVAHCQYDACRPEKKQLCNNVRLNNASLATWRGHEMAALLQLVYQVRCNLVHGDKRLAAEDVQTARDWELIRVSSQILDRVLEWLIHVP
jgi:hypothetical protein